MKQGQALKAGEVLVWASREADYLSGRGQKATVVKIQTVVPEGKAKGIKMVLAQIDGEPEPRHLSYRDLWPDWDRYHARHQELRLAARDAVAVAQDLLERLVALDVVEAPPTDETQGEGRGGIYYWTSPVRYRRQPDMTPIGVQLHLSPLGAKRLLEALVERTT